VAQWPLLVPHSHVTEAVANGEHAAEPEAAPVAADQPAAAAAGGAAAAAGGDAAQAAAGGDAAAPAADTHAPEAPKEHGTDSLARSHRDRSRSR
jgi:hypothetical protein